MKDETAFRIARINPFLKTLKHTYFMAVQQVSARGDADYILSVRGLFVWMEAKTDTGELGQLQEFKLKQVKERGGIAIVVRPSNFSMVKEYLEQLDGGVNDNDLLQRIEQYEIQRVRPKIGKHANEHTEGVSD